MMRRRRKKLSALVQKSKPAAEAAIHAIMERESMVDDTHDSRDEERERGKEEEQGEGRGGRERQAGGGETTISRHFLLVAPRFK